MTLLDQIALLADIMQVWTIKGDDLWMSEAYGTGAFVVIHFTWKPNNSAVSNFLLMVEQALRPYNARPHWGKFFTMVPKSQPNLYPKLNDFKFVEYFQILNFHLFF